VFTGENQVLLPRSLYFRNPFKKPFPGTFHGFTGKAGDPIDWILYRGSLIPEIAEVIQNIYLSDHFPVHAAFRWGG
jgi:endonuclease/exonuclease/phosphatase (EEP) superfamily protein YafD